MRTNIYIFSNTILSRKDNTFKIEKMKDVTPIHEVDLYEDERENVLIPAYKAEGDGSPKFLPAETIEAFYTFGEIRFSSQFLKCLYKYSILLHVFNYYGKYIGSFLPANLEGDGNIQIIQYQFYLNAQKRLYIAKRILESAVKNILDNLFTYTYQGVDLDDSILEINFILDKIKVAESIDELLGLEGNIRNIYYSCWHKILKDKVQFEKREKNPPIGMINSLISFGNSLLYSVCLTELYRTRLNPFIGFIHEPGHKKHPLVYDISEIFKPIIVDKVIFKFINLNMIDEDDFKIKGDVYLLKEKSKQKFVEEFEKRLSTVINHKRLNRRISYRSLIRMEGYNLINYMTGKLKTYEPYKSQ